MLEVHAGPVQHDRLGGAVPGPLPAQQRGVAAPVDEELRERVFSQITAEHERTCRVLLAITGDDHLLADNPSLARSIRNRFPYLEPLHHLQVEMLRRRRDGDDDELTRRNIQLTINGIATALRNSG